MYNSQYFIGCPLNANGEAMRVLARDIDRFARNDVHENSQWISSLSDHNNPKMSEDSRIAHRRIMHGVFEALFGQRARSSGPRVNL